MKRSYKFANPFYSLLLIAGIAFAITATAYGVMAFREREAGGLPAPSAAHGTAEHPLMMWLNQHGETGLVVPPGDPDALRAALASLADAPDLRRRLGAQARTRALATFTAEQMCDGACDVYREASGAAGPQAVAEGEVAEGEVAARASRSVPASEVAAAMSARRLPEPQAVAAGWSARRGPRSEPARPARSVHR